MFQLDQNLHRQVVLGGDGGRNVLITTNVRGGERRAGIQLGPGCPSASWLCQFLLYPEAPCDSKGAASSQRVTTSQNKTRGKRAYSSLNTLSTSLSVWVTCSSLTNQGTWGNTDILIGQA